MGNITVSYPNEESIMTTTPTDAITAEQRQLLDDALAAIEQRGDRVSVTALRAEAKVRQNIASAYWREVRDARANADAEPELPTDPEVVTSIVGAVYPVAYRVARSVVQDELAAARDLADRCDEAQARAEDERDDARAERDEAVAEATAARDAAVSAQQAAEAERDDALAKAAEATERVAAAEQAQREAEARVAASDGVVAALRAELAERHAALMDAIGKLAAAAAPAGTKTRATKRA